MAEKFSLTVEQLQPLIDQNLSYREMGRTLGCHFNTVKRWIGVLGLNPGRERGIPPTPVDADHSLCSKCNEVTRNDDFPYVINRSDGRRLSYCRKCRWKQSRTALGENPTRYWNDRNTKTKRRAEGLEIPYALTGNYLLETWERQGRTCFYTDIDLPTAYGTDAKLFAPSIDKVRIDLGYVPGNVVICSGRANSIKYDQTLEELQVWMPGWYQRLVDCEWVTSV